jgi:hypothetical protein
MTYEGKSAAEVTVIEDTTQTEPILRRTLLKTARSASRCSEHRCKKWCKQPARSRRPVP